MGAFTSHRYFLRLWSIPNVACGKYVFCVLDQLNSDCRMARRLLAPICLQLRSCAGRRCARISMLARTSDRQRHRAQCQRRLKISPLRRFDEIISASNPASPCPKRHWGDYLSGSALQVRSLCCDNQARVFDMILAYRAYTSRLKSVRPNSSNQNRTDIAQSPIRGQERKPAQAARSNDCSAAPWGQSRRRDNHCRPGALRGGH